MKFCVIGLGRFGYQLAVGLAENGMEVMAVDENEKIVESIRDKVTQAVCFHIEDENSLRALGIQDMDTAIVAMGENFTGSIIITALLKKHLNISYVIARARNKIHGTILKLTGVDKVIMPERDSGIRLAKSLSLQFSEFVPLTESFAITQIQAPPEFVGKTIAELQLRKSRNVACLAVHKDDSTVLVGLEYVVMDGDILVLCGANKDLAKFNQV